MAKQLLHFKCLVISPSDVEDARDAVTAAVSDWNAHAGEGLGAKVEAVRWESHARPELGSAPQAIINKQLVDDCDFGIAIFWSRLGSATAEHASGSIEEIERLLTKGANVMVYFCDAPIPQEALRDDQFQRLQAIKKSYRDRGLLAGYSNVGELRQILPLHINGTMNSLVMQQRAAGQPIPSQGTTTAPMPDIRVTIGAGYINQGFSTIVGVIVEVQNHSPNDFFLSSIYFQRAGDRSLLVFGRDFVTREHLNPRKIEPGNSFTFIVDPDEVVKGLEGQEPATVIVKDKIDRQFYSREGEFTTAMRNAMMMTRSLHKNPS